jgi:hypothetical protein
MWQVKMRSRPQKYVFAVLFYVGKDVHLYTLFLSAFLILILSLIFKENINKENMNANLISLESIREIYNDRKVEPPLNSMIYDDITKARSLMNLHNNEAGRRVSNYLL